MLLQVVIGFLGPEVGVDIAFLHLFRFLAHPQVLGHLLLELLAHELLFVNVVKHFTLHHFFIPLHRAMVLILVLLLRLVLGVDLLLVTIHCSLDHCLPHGVGVLHDLRVLLRGNVIGVKEGLDIGTVLRVHAN